MHSAHAATGVEPIPHGGSTVPAKVRADEKTALPVRFPQLLIVCIVKYKYAGRFSIFMADG